MLEWDRDGRAMTRSKINYSPEAFRVTDRARLEAFLNETGFGMVLSVGERGVVQHSAIPLLLSSDHQFLEGHVARSNPHWRAWTESVKVSVLFQGPHAYVSPRWYVSQPQVPTWNYAVVRVEGTVALVEDRAEGLEFIRRLVARYEGTGDKAWAFDAESDFGRGLFAGIVCFRIRIDHIEGVFKMSQNKAPADRAGAIHGLIESGSWNDLACAEFMKRDSGQESLRSD